MCKGINVLEPHFNTYKLISEMLAGIISILQTEQKHGEMKCSVSQTSSDSW